MRLTPKQFYFLVFLAVIYLLFMRLAMTIYAWEDEDGNFIVCHCEQPDSNSPFQCQTLHLPLPAAQSHLDNHSADYEDACRPQATPAQEPTFSPTPVPTAQLTPTTAVTATPEATPTEELKITVSPTATITEAPPTQSWEEEKIIYFPGEGGVLYGPQK
jgi:hypothetical protein